MNSQQSKCKLCQGVKPLNNLDEENVCKSCRSYRKGTVYTLDLEQEDSDWVKEQR
jgi:hypothetical protein